MKAIEGFPGYSITRDGKVYTSVRINRAGVPPKTTIWITFDGEPREMTLRQNRQGHLRVGLTKDGKQVWKFVHHLVLEAFVGPRPKGKQCRHLNGVPTDNRAENLAWGTAKENTDDKVRHGTIPFGSRHGNAKMTEEMVARFRQEIKTKSASQIAREVGLHPTTVQKAVRGAFWKHVPR